MSTMRVISTNFKKTMLSEAFEEYHIKNKICNLSSATIKNYREGYERFAKVIGSDMLCEDVTVKIVDLFTAKLIDEGLKAASVNHYLRSIRSFLYWCMAEGYIQQFKIRLIKEPQPIKPTYSDTQIRLLIREPIKQASFVEWRCWAMVCWFLATGNRAETACNIKMGDISFETREVQINRTKTNRAMILPLSNELAKILKKYIGMFRSHESDEEYLFCNVGNKKLTVNALKISISKYNRKRGVNLTSLHAFRHTFAKNWIRNTGDVFKLQKILGHKTLEMTRRYVNMFHDDLKHEYEKYCPLDRIKFAGNAKSAIDRRAKKSFKW
ncbi:MAG: tyrosine-type recombinase/integrase [Christensenellales bacterium]